MIVGKKYLLVVLLILALFLLEAPTLFSDFYVDLLTKIMIFGAVFVVMRNYSHEKKIPHIVPTAGNIELAGNLFSPYVFRSSISHWIFAHPMGYWVYDNLGSECFVAGANYGAGQHQVWAFSIAYRGEGGKIIGVVWPPLNEKDYASYLTKIADSGAKVYFGWFAGNDAVNFCRQAAQFGLELWPRLKLHLRRLRRQEFLWDSMSRIKTSFHRSSPKKPYPCPMSPLLREGPGVLGRLYLVEDL